MCPCYCSRQACGNNVAHFSLTSCHGFSPLSAFFSYSLPSLLVTLILGQYRSKMAVTPKSCHSAFESLDVDDSCEADLTSSLHLPVHPRHPAARSRGVEIASDKLTQRPQDAEMCGILPNPSSPCCKSEQILIQPRHISGILGDQEVWVFKLI